MPVDALPLDFLLPFAAVEWPTPAASTPIVATDPDDDESDTEEVAPPSSAFLRDAPFWLRERQKKSSCFAAARMDGTSWAIIGYQDGSLDVYGSVPEQESPRMPNSPPQLNFPPISLLPPAGRSAAARPRMSSAASFRSIQSASDMSRASTRTRRASRVQPGAKAAATLSVSGLEAFVAQPPEAKGVLSPLLRRSEDHPDNLLSQTAARSRESLEQTLSPAPSPDSDSENVPDEHLQEKLQLRLTTVLRSKRGREVAQAEVIDSASLLHHANAPRTPAAIVLTKGGDLYKVSLKDGRGRKLFGFAGPPCPRMGFRLAYLKGHAYVIVYGIGRLKAYGVSEQKIIDECNVPECDDLQVMNSALVLRSLSGALFTLQFSDDDAKLSFGMLHAHELSCRTVAVDRRDGLVYLHTNDDTVVVARLSNESHDFDQVIERQVQQGAIGMQVLAGHILVLFQDACRLYDEHLQLESSTADLPPGARFSSFDLLGQTLLCQQEDRLALVNVQDSQLVVAELAPIVHPPEAAISTAICTSHEQLLAGYRTGQVALISPRALLQQAAVDTLWSQLFDETAVVYLKEFRGAYLAGSSDGQVAMLDQNLDVTCRWTVFASPLCYADFVTLENTEYLLLIDQAGTTALTTFRDGADVKLLIPASPSALKTVHISWPTLVLCYSSGKARMFDIPTAELRRSLTEELALAEVADSSWHLLDIRDEAQSYAVRIDLRQLIHKNVRVQPEAVNNGTHATGMVSVVLRSLLTPGLSNTVDNLINELLSNIGSHKAYSASIPSQGGLSLHCVSDATDPWKVSRHSSTYRLLALITLVRLSLHSPNLERPASELIVYFTTFLVDRVGPGFQKPSLHLVADYWHDNEVSVSESAKILLGATVSVMTKNEVLAEADRWHSLLPLADDVVSLTSTQSKALLIIGLLCVDHHADLPLVMLKDMATLVCNLLAQSQQIIPLKIGLELCDRCFELIQEFCDPVKLMHSLVSLTSDNAQAVAIRPLVSRALISVASSNPQLFITTLSFDALHTKSAEHRIAIMKLVVFMVRRKPVIFYAYLVQIVEAVLRALDPHDPSLRSSTQSSATSTLADLVRTYPSIDFHRGTQKLAVGTFEGASIMYDLKTATRLYVLTTPGVTRPCTAVSFSPDGRRLVTLSLDARVVSVWKVGSSLMGLVSWGKVPRQHGVHSTIDEGPFKTFDVPLTSDNSDLQVSDILSMVSMEWLGDRSVKLRIREAAFTFSL